MEDIENLINTIKSNEGEARIKALVICQNLSVATENRVSMGSEHVGLLPLLVSIIEQDQGEARIKALSVCCNLSVATENLVSMGSEHVGLLPLLVSIIKQDQGEARIRALSVCWNLVHYESIKLMTLQGAHKLLFNTLLAAGDCSAYKKGGYEEKIMNFFLSFARHSEGAKALREVSGSVSFFTNMLSTNDSINKLKSSFIISYLIGKDEAVSSDDALLQRNPDLLQALVEVFQNTMDSKGGKGYYLGVFEIPSIVSAILALSISDGNKGLLVNSSSLLELIIVVLEMYRDDKPGIEACFGGGDDLESAEVAIETLLQLSFHFDNDEDLRLKYMTPNLKVAELMTSLLNLPSSRKFRLGHSAKQSASILLKRLTVVKIESISPTKGTKSVHVMFSYAWGCGKERVMMLQQKLVELGYDIWRDETGSSIVDNMSGFTDDRMAEAIEASCTIIVFVSPQYK